MKTIDKKKWKRVIYPLLFIILSAIITFNIIRINRPSNRVIAYRVDSGWGYKIIHNDRTVIDQSFIPLLSGRNPFPSRSSAQQTGKLVLQRLENGTVPVITFEDLEELGLMEEQ